MEKTLTQTALAIDIDSGTLTYLTHAQGLKTEVGTVVLDEEAGMKQALENAVYDTPLLLEEYHHTTIVMHSQHFSVMPAELMPRASQVLQASFSSLEGETLVCQVKNTGVAIACDVPRGVTAFLNRTFASSTLLHHLAPLIAYCADAYADENGCLHINVTPQAAHIVATRGGQLLLANTYPYHSLDDVTYFALAAFKECHFDPRADKILLTGEGELIATLSQQLRPRIAYVMPELIPPQALTTLGNEAMTLPFNIIATAIY